VTWTRVEVIDEYDEDGRRAILVGDSVVVVSELAATILDALPAETPVVAERLLESFGPPPIGLDQAVRQALNGLSDAGLVNETSTTE
jgi:hypothetical protein